MKPIPNRKFITGIIIIILELAVVIFFFNYGYKEKNKTYEDGDYCAVVEYFNPNTDKESKYLLTVTVKNGNVIIIHFNNGGWLDESHFEAAKLDGKGKAIIIDDRDYEYSVSIFKDNPCNGNDKLTEEDYENEN